MKRTLMIVDDIYANRFLVTQLFPDDIVICVENGAAMWEKLEETVPDIILMDVNLPDEDGFELTKQLKASEQYQHVPVVFLTVHYTKNDVMKAADAGGDGYITKPFQEEVLVKRVNKVLIDKRLRELRNES